jgi:spore coat protein U-like protein
MIHRVRFRRVLGPLVAIASVFACETALAVGCSATVSAITFGAYDLFSGSPLDSTGSVAVTCQKDTADGNNAITVNYQIAISAGSSASFTQRSMRSGTATLGYNVYSNSTYTSVWGDGSGAAAVTGSMKLINPRDVITNQHTAYGRVPAAQDVGAGGYADTLLVTVTY